MLLLQQPMLKRWVNTTATTTKSIRLQPPQQQQRLLFQTSSTSSSITNDSRSPAVLSSKNRIFASTNTAANCSRRHNIDGYQYNSYSTTSTKHQSSTSPDDATVSTPTSTTTTPSTPSTPLPFDTVGIIGLGLMGHGIAQVSAQATSTQSIIAYDTQDSYLQAGRTRIQQSLSLMVQKQKMTLAEMEHIQSKITYTTNVHDLVNSDLIIEAVIEDMALKQQLYTQLSSICPANTIFASNTSSLSITQMANYTNRPHQFVGIHFFNPVQMMKLVEIIQTTQTDPIVYERVQHFVRTTIGKIPVSCHDTPGFIVNRLLVPSLLQAMAMVERRHATIMDIDLSLQYGAGHPMGPLHLSDYIGLDTIYNIAKGWVQEYPNEPSFFIPPLLQQMVLEQQHYGRKNGRGFYEWNGNTRGNSIELPVQLQ
jgi:3-hydroxyacyl-CoA dehydrogenase